MKPRRLKTKLLGMVLLAIAIMVALIVTVNQRSVTVQIRDDVRKRLDSARFAYREIIKDRCTRMRDMNHVLALAPKVRANLARRDPLTLLQTIAEVIDGTKDLSFYMVHFAPITEEPASPGETGGLLLQEPGQDSIALVNPRVNSPASESLIPGTEAEPTITTQDEAQGIFDTFEDWKAQLMDAEQLKGPLLAFVEKRNAELAKQYEEVTAARQAQDVQKPYPDESRTFISTFQGKLYLFVYQPISTGEQFKKYVGLVMAGLRIRHDLADIIRDSSMGHSLTVSFLSVAQNGAIELQDHSRWGQLESAQLVERAPRFVEALREGKLVPDGKPIDIVVGTTTYVVQAMPMTGVQEAEGSQTEVNRGVAVLEVNISDLLDPLVSEITTGPLYISLIVAVIAFAFLWDRFRAWVTDPVHALTDGMNRIQAGDLDTPIDLKSEDEMGDLADSFNQMLGDLRKKQTYMKMISEKAVEEIEKKGKAEVAGEGERRVVTVLFSDIRDFTTLCERIDPNKLIQLLNKHFDVMVQVIQRNNGSIDKFIGDAIMAVFERGDHARNAVLAALEMQAESKRLDVEEKLGLRIGVGLHTGETIFGYVGTKKMFFGTYLGDTVNVAARLEAQSKYGKHSKIIISKQTFEAVGSLVDVATLDETHVKGKTEAVHMFEIVKILEDRQILDGLRSLDAAERRRCAVIAGNLMDARVFETLLDLARDRDEEVALAALQGISRVVVRTTDRDLLPPILELIEKETRVKVRSALAVLLGTTGDHRASGALERLLSDEDPRVRANAVESVEKIGGRTLVKLVRPRLEDSNNRVKTNAAILLFESDPDGVTARLLEDLKAESAMMRASAAFAMCQVAYRFPTLLPGQLRDRLQQHEYRMAQNFQLMIRELTRVSPSETEPVPRKWIQNALQALLGYETARSILDQAAHEALEAEEKQLLQ